MERMKDSEYFAAERVSDNVLKVFANVSKNTQFKYPPNYTLQKLECGSSKGWLKLPIRTPMCDQVTCVYNYDDSTQKYRCDKCSGTDIGNMYVDLRLSAVLARLLQTIQQNQTKKLPKLVNLGSKIILSTDESRNLKVTAKIGDKSYTVQQNQFKDTNRLSMSQGAIETKSQIISEYKRETLRHLQSKRSLKKLTKDLESQIHNIVEKVKYQELYSQLQKAIPRREIKKTQKLFGFSEGQIYILNGEQLQKPVIVGIQQDFKTFLGASWFYAYINKSHNFYAVGGSTAKKTYEKGILKFTMQQNNKNLISRQVVKNNNDLQILNPAVVFVSEVSSKMINKAYIFGGINCSTGKPEKNILEFDVQKSIITKIGQMQTHRFNHCAVKHKKYIYILGGLDYNKCKEQNQKLNYDSRVSILNYDWTDKKLQIFDIETKQSRVENTISYVHDLKRMFCRGIATVVPYSGRDFIVLFGCNTGNLALERKSIALDLQKLSWNEFGDNNIKLSLTTGQDKIISNTMNIVDFEGLQAQNSTKFLYVTESGKYTEFVLTSRDAQSTYVWKY